MRPIVLAIIAVWSLMVFPKDAPPQPQLSLTRLPGLRATGFWPGVCPKVPPYEIDLNKDGHRDLLFPVCQRGRFKEYTAPEEGAQYGLLGNILSRSLGTANQNFTYACALDGSTGKLLWEFRCGGLITDHLLSNDGARLFLVSHDDRLYSLDTSTGKVIWTHNFGGNVLGLCAGADRMVAVTMCKRITAIGLRDGAVLWDVPVRAGLMRMGWGYCLSDETSVYVSSLDNLLRCLDISNGTTRWSCATQRDPSLKALTGKTLLVCEGKSLLMARDTETGKVRWTYDTKGIPFFEPLELVGNLVYGVSGGAHNRLFCLDLSSGTERWSHPLPPVFKDPNRPVLLPEEERFYHATFAMRYDEDGAPAALFAADLKNLLAFSPLTGAVQWSAPVQNAQFFFLSRDSVLVQDDDRKLRCLNIASGKERWAVTLDRLLHQAVECGELFLCLPYDQSMLALEASSGHQASTILMGDPAWVQPWGDGKALVSDRFGTTVLGPAIRD
jgi:outer membrane protein assembly factor BamB